MELVGVWTDKPELTDMVTRNKGVSEFLIVVCNSREEARNARDKLYSLYGDDKLFIRAV